MTLVCAKVQQTQAIRWLDSARQHWQLSFAALTTTASGLVAAAQLQSVQEELIDADDRLQSLERARLALRQDLQAPQDKRSALKAMLQERKKVWEWVLESVLAAAQSSEH